MGGPLEASPTMTLGSLSVVFSDTHCLALSDGRDSVKGVGESTLTASRHEFTAEIRITRQRLANIFLVKIHEMFLITFFGYVKVNVTRVTGSCVSYLESKT